MSYKIIYSHDFARQAKALAKKYPSLKQDLEVLQMNLIQNPKQGDNLGSNIYKVRVAIASKGKGKSGGARVITFVLTEDKEIYLLTIYDKSEMESVSRAYIQSIIDSLNE